MIDRVDLTAHEKFIYTILARYANENDEAFPSYSTLAQKSSLSKNTVIKAIRGLESKGLLHKKIRRINSTENTTNLYTLMSADSENQEYKEIEQGSASDELPSSVGEQPSATDAPPPSAPDEQPSAPGEPKKDLLKKTNLFNNTNLKIDFDVLRERYSESQLEVIDTFIDILRHTRKHGKIAGSVIAKMFKSWLDFKTEFVIYALAIYIENPKHHDKRESYVLGIMRRTTSEQVADYNANKNRVSTVKQVKSNPNNRFHNFDQQYHKKSNKDFEKFMNNKKTS